jgi:hypothetical protein
MKNGNIFSFKVELKGINHFFQEVTNNIPFNYGRIKETISVKVLELVCDWIKRQLMQIMEGFFS